MKHSTEPDVHCYYVENRMQILCIATPHFCIALT